MSHELLVDLDAADQPYHGAYGVDQPGQRVEVGGHHAGRLGDAAQAVALGQRRSRSEARGGQGQKQSFFHTCRLLFLGVDEKPQTAPAPEEAGRPAAVCLWG